MAVIFDLDQTLIDSSSAERLRQRKDWISVYDTIPQLKPYEQINEIIQMLNENNIPVAIVTSSPRPYCERVISKWKWDIDATVCYHCTANKKPHPEPIELALKRLKIKDKNKVISIGDHAKDIIASKAAGIYSVGCTWGIKDSKELLEAKPDAVINSTSDLKNLLVAKFNLK